MTKLIQNVRGNDSQMRSLLLTKVDGVYHFDFYSKLKIEVGDFLMSNYLPTMIGCNSMRITEIVANEDSKGVYANKKDAKKTLWKVILEHASYKPEIAEEDDEK